MRTIHWWLVDGHWFSAIANVGESAQACLMRQIDNMTVMVISKPYGWTPIEWMTALRYLAIHKAHLSSEIPADL